LHLILDQGGTESAAEKATAAATKAAGEKASPKVLNTTPADGATKVPVNSLISVTFSESMSSPTINGNTFTVRKADVSAPIAGTISLSPEGRTAMFDPTPDLEPNISNILSKLMKEQRIYLIMHWFQQNDGHLLPLLLLLRRSCYKTSRVYI
jgi:hypothetical protein